jgi:hypothetical protein
MVNLLHPASQLLVSSNTSSTDTTISSTEDRRQVSDSFGIQNTGFHPHHRIIVDDAEVSPTLSYLSTVALHKKALCSFKQQT